MQKYGRLETFASREADMMDYFSGEFLFAIVTEKTCHSLNAVL